MLFVVYVLQFLARQKNIGVGQVVVVVLLFCCFTEKYMCILKVEVLFKHNGHQCYHGNKVAHVYMT